MEVKQCRDGGLRSSLDLTRLLRQCAGLNRWTWIRRSSIDRYHQQRNDGLSVARRSFSSATTPTHYTTTNHHSKTLRQYIHRLIPYRSARNLWICFRRTCKTCDYVRRRTLDAVRTSQHGTFINQPICLFIVMCE